MPFMIVWPDSWSVETVKDGSSATILASATPSFSWSALDLGSMAISMTGAGEVHLLQDDRRLGGIAQGVAGAGVLQAGQGDDVAGVGFLDVLAVVGVHQQHAADAFLACRASS